MVDARGYIKLIDFGTAKISPGRAYTLVGTPHYMAPEVIIGEGYGKAADLWSVGICLYEFLCGGVPFGEEEEDPYAIYAKILDMNLVYTHVDQNNFPARPLVEQLLSNIPEMRVGVGFEALKKQNWLQCFDCDGLISQKLTPPYTADVGDIAEEESDMEDDAVADRPWDEKLSALSDSELEMFKQTIPKYCDKGF